MKQEVQPRFSTSISITSRKCSLNIGLNTLQGLTKLRTLLYSRKLKRPSAPFWAIFERMSQPIWASAVKLHSNLLNTSILPRTAAFQCSIQALNKARLRDRSFYYCSVMTPTCHKQKYAYLKHDSQTCGGSRWRSWLRHCATSRGFDSPWCHWNFSLT
jgi:hypothetical protein